MNEKIFRFFGGDGELAFVEPYAEILDACRAWVAGRPEVAAMVHIQPILEVGTDFIVRSHKQAYVTLRTYHEQEQPGYQEEYLEPPPELAEMRAMMTRALAGESSGREKVVRGVLSASLLQGSGKTVEDHDHTWLILEPSIGPEDLQAWIDAVPSPDPKRGLLDALAVYPRQGSGEYFDSGIADVWPEKWWGWPGFAAQRLEIPIDESTLDLFRVDSASPGLRAEVSTYLDAGAMAMVGQVPEQQCEYCDRMIHVASSQSDGEWLWTSDLGHQVLEHGFFVPNRLVDHIRTIGQPPVSFDTPVEDLPWPTKQ